jgi:hypothetical protein
MVVVAGTRGDLDEAQVRRYLTVRSRVVMRAPHGRLWSVGGGRRIGAWI